MNLAPKIRKIRNIKSNLSLRDFYNKRNKILIIRDGGGVGDIMMLRMMLEDFQDIMPEAEIVIATTPNYFEMISDHPFVKDVVNSRQLDENQYLISYNVTSACIRYEMKIAPNSDMHRSDIWAAHCGVRLKKHNMHLSVSSEMKEWAVKYYAKLGMTKRPIVLFSPISNMQSKDLNPTQIKEVVKKIQELGLDIFVLHKSPLPDLECPMASGISMERWLACISQADYVITVDTGTFHVANGFNKPTLAIYGWADGNVYGKYHEKMILVQRHKKDLPGWCGPCYNWTRCKECPQSIMQKPCLSQITSEEIYDNFVKLMEKYPVNHQ